MDISNPPQAFDLEYFLKLAPEWVRRAFYFPEIGSTNQEARVRLRSASGPAEILLIADKQTAGRGRMNRAWEAPFATGLLCTLTTPLAPLPLDRAYLYTAALALSLKQAAWLEAGIELALKWPNDLLREGRKCCGILAELELGLGPGQSNAWLALGFGLNTGLTERDFREAGLLEKATNLTPFDQPPVQREALLATTIQAFEGYRLRLQEDLESVRQEWAASLITIGQEVQVLNSSGQVELSGRAEGVDFSGGLQVRETTGKIKLVQAGDVSVRLADGRYA
ncbi:MAG TPA: biotin--[acetyl-CoA-carboxylase] ligase [Chloroflexia bacterium]|nr:biotin--[acetyl-CoA-carboxylase] ligase [Chloroflexia bacterium]